MGDLALRDEILSIFDEHALVLLAQFNEAQTDEAWSNTAHSLKGASRGIGAWALGDLCEEAEKLVGPDPDKTEKREVAIIAIKNKISKILVESKRIKDVGLCA